MSNQINVTNNGPTQQQFGDNNSQTMNVAGSGDVHAAIQGLEKVFNDAAADDTEVLTSSVMSSEPNAVFAQLKELAAEPAPAPEQIEEATSNWRALLSKYGPKVAKACGAFAEVALTKYAESNPLIAGVVAALKTLQD
jgi:hypothetical protein